MPGTRAASALLLLLLSSGAGATALCRWVDATGRTQIAEVVPEQYRKVAICTDSQRYELSPEQQQAAQQQVANEKAQARRAATGPAAEAASSARRPAGGASQSNAKRPTEVVTEATDCTTWWRLYDESVECFGPYRTTRGATRVEAFDHCNVIASPVPRCGPRSH